MSNQQNDMLWEDLVEQYPCEGCEETPGRLHNNMDPSDASVPCPDCDGKGYDVNNMLLDK